MRIDRRSLLKTSAAVSSAALMPRLGATASLNSAALDRFIVDSRVPESLAAARSAAAHGIEVSEVDGNLTSLWYDDLNLKWQTRPMTLAGMTGEDALFVLSTLAPQYGMRVSRQEQIGRQEILHRSPLLIYSWTIAPA